MLIAIDFDNTIARVEKYPTIIEPVPAGLINPDEVPEGWGLLEVKKKSIWQTKEAKPFLQNENALRKEIGFLSRGIRDVKCGIIIVANEAEGGEE